MAFGWDDALLLGGTSLVTSAASQGLGALVGSGGTSANDQIDLWQRMYLPQEAAGGLSRADVQAMAENRAYERNLASSAKSNLDYNAALNLQYPTWMRRGLEAAGYNPILAVTGNYDGKTGSLSAPGGQGLDIGHTSRPSRALSSALGADSIYKMLRGSYDADLDNTKADTALKAADTDLRPAQKADILAGADVKKAEADFIRARAATETAMLPGKVEDINRTVKYGSGLVGSVSRLSETVGEKVNGVVNQLLEDSASSAKDVDKFISPVVVKPLTSSARQVDDVDRRRQRASDYMERQRRLDNARRIRRSRMFGDPKYESHYLTPNVSIDEN